MKHSPGIVLALTLATGLAGCVELPRQRFEFRGTLTDHFKEAPYYVDYAQRDTVPNAAIACPPVTLEPRTVYDNGFYRGREHVFRPLLEVMNQHLERGGICQRIDDWDPLAEGAPDVYAGSGEAVYAPIKTVRAEYETDPQMVVTMTPASPEWRAANAPSVANTTDYLLIVRLGVTEYPKLAGKLQLGTEHRQRAGFLRQGNVAEVVQVTAMLLDRDGKIMRAGAEGISAKSTNLADCTAAGFLYWDLYRNARQLRNRHHVHRAAPGFAR